MFNIFSSLIFSLIKYICNKPLFYPDLTEAPGFYSSYEKSFLSPFAVVYNNQCAFITKV